MKKKRLIVIKKNRPEGFADFMRKSPLHGVDLNLQRDESATRPDQDFDQDKTIHRAKTKPG
jgi:hypothetical protein